MSNSSGSTSSDAHFGIMVAGAVSAHALLLRINITKELFDDETIRTETKKDRIGLGSGWS